MPSAFQKRGVQFRTSPSSALYSSSGAGFGNDPQRALANAAAGRPTVDFPVQAAPTPGGAFGNRIGYPGYTPPPNPNAFGVTNPLDPSGQIAAAYESYDEFARRFLAQQQAAQALQGIDPADQAAIDAEFALRAKEAALQQAVLDGDYAEAARLQGEIAANKAGLTAASTHTRQMAEPQMELALRFAKQINERNAPPIAANTAQEMGAIGQAYQGAAQQTTDTSQLIQSGDAALQAALKIAGADQDLYLERSFNRGKHARNIVGFTEDAAVAGNELTAATFQRQMLESEAMDKQHWADEDRNIAEIFANLARRKEQMAIDAERNRLDKENLERGLTPDVDYEGTNALEVGQNAGYDYIVAQMGDGPLHRTAYLQGQFQDLFQDPEFQVFTQGNFTPAKVRAYYAQVDADTGQTFADFYGLSTNDVEILAGAIGVYSSASSSWTAGDDFGPSGSPIAAVRRGGEADNLNPQNIADAKAGVGPYGARAAFAAEIAPQIASQYGLRADGANYFRPVGAHEGNPDRSANSDHITAGAIDFHGTQAAMEAALKDLQNRPYVSFARIHGSPPHLHVSFDIGSF